MSLLTDKLNVRIGRKTITKAQLDSVSNQPRSQGLFLARFGAGREKALASAGHMRTLHPEILGVIN